MRRVKTREIDIIFSPHEFCFNFSFFQTTLAQRRLLPAGGHRAPGRLRPRLRATAAPGTGHGSGPGERRKIPDGFIAFDPRVSAGRRGKRSAAAGEVCGIGSELFRRCKMGKNESLGLEAPSAPPPCTGEMPTQENTKKAREKGEKPVLPVGKKKVGFFPPLKFLKIFLNYYYFILYFS